MRKQAKDEKKYHQMKRREPDPPKENKLKTTMKCKHTQTSKKQKEVSTDE